MAQYRFSWWHQGVFLYDESHAWPDDHAEYKEAGSNNAWLGQSPSQEVTYVSPGFGVFDSEDAPLTLEVLDQAPAYHPEAESIGDFDLIVPSGRLAMEESGGGGSITVIDVPPGEWRARWSGFGQSALDAVDAEPYTSESRPDSYLLQLWPRVEAAPVELVKGY